MTRGTRIAVMFVLAAGCCAAAGVHGSGGDGLVPKPFAIEGYAEAKLTHYQLNRDGAFYRTAFANQPQRGTLDRANAMLMLTGTARTEEGLLRFRTHSEVENDQVARESENRFDELYVSWKPRPDFTLDAGKIELKWGKGHSWNPVAFAERAKDPNDPRLSREGYTMIATTLTRNLPGALETVVFTPLLLPVTEGVNSDFGRRGHLNLAGRLQLLYRDTDIDFYFLNNGSRSRRFGADFSHDLANGLEIYGEWARIGAQDFRLTAPTGVGYTRREAVTSYLAGASFRTQPGTSFVIELQRNGTGLSADEYRDFIALVDNAVQAGAGSPLMERAQTLADGRFGRPKALRNYLYVRASQRTLPFTPSIRVTVNLQDGSYSLAPELLYNIRGQWGLRARLTVFSGDPGSEYGEKYYSRRVELRLHYHF